MFAFQNKCKRETWVGGGRGVADIRFCNHRIVRFLEVFPQSHEQKWAAESDTSPHKHRRGSRSGLLLTRSVYQWVTANGLLCV